MLQSPGRSLGLKQRTASKGRPWAACKTAFYSGKSNSHGLIPRVCTFWGKPHFGEKKNFLDAQKHTYRSKPGKMNQLVPNPIHTSRHLCQNGSSINEIALNYILKMKKIELTENS